MKSCKVLQIVFGVFCAILAVAVGLTSIMLLLPYLGIELDITFFATISTGLDAVADDLGIAGLGWVVMCIAFVVPTILLVVATILLIRGKHGKTIVAGGIVAYVGTLLCAILLAVFSKLLFADLQGTIIWILVAVTAVCALLYSLTASAVRRAKNAPQTDAESNDTNPNMVDAPTESGTTQGATDATPVVTDGTTQPSETDGVTYMPSDHGSVGEVADQTYEQNDVLSPKVLEKLKIARDLYEKGALTKEEYLGIVSKYINQ